MIVVDDCSADKSAEIVDAIAKKEPRIRLIRLDKNSGPAIARNIAIKASYGRYIAFLDSDDLWLPQKLEKQIDFIRRTDAGLVYSGYHMIEEESGERIGTVSIPARVDYRELLKQNVIGCLTALYDTEKLGKVYMPEIMKRQDFALWLKILKQIPYAYGLNEPLACYRVRNASVSSNKILSSLYNWKLYRDIEKLPLHRALYYFGWYTYRSFLKYKIIKERG